MFQEKKKHAYKQTNKPKTCLLYSWAMVSLDDFFFLNTNRITEKKKKKRKLEEIEEKEIKENR